MVLESLYDIKNIIRKPLNMLLLSFVASLISIYLAHYIFPAYAGVIMTLLLTVILTPIFYKIFQIEEELEEKQAEGKINLSFIERHGEVLTLFSLFFIGNFLATFLVYSIAPGEFVTSAFAAQVSEIQSIRGVATGNAISGGAVSGDLVSIIMFNNLRVMLFSFFLSFLLGTGAIFILSWNATILGVFLGDFIRNGMIGQFFAQSLGIFPHAVIEIGAYFLAGMAGGVLSVGIIREKINSKEFHLVFRDSLLLLALGILAVVVGSFVEVYL